MEKKYRSVAAIIVKKEDKYLLAKKPRVENAWQFPQGGVEKGEKAEVAAVRELNEECGKTLRVELNPVPVGFYSYRFPQDFKRHKKGVIGAEVVFFKAVYKSGTVEIDNNEIVDHMWVSKKNIQKEVSAKYWEIVKDWL